MGKVKFSWDWFHRQFCGLYGRRSKKIFSNHDSPKGGGFQISHSQSGELGFGKVGIPGFVKFQTHWKLGDNCGGQEEEEKTHVLWSPHFMASWKLMLMQQPEANQDQKRGNFICSISGPAGIKESNVSKVIVITEALRY